MSMKLYDIHINVHCGEREFLARSCVAAGSIEEAVRYAEKFTACFWGEGAVQDEEGRWWNGEVACKLSGVYERPTITAPRADGKGSEKFTIVGPDGVAITNECLAKFLEGEDIDVQDFAGYLRTDIPEWLRENLKSYREHQRYDERLAEAHPKEKIEDEEET